jgi:hypothetical protein
MCEDMATYFKDRKHLIMKSKDVNPYNEKQRIIDTINKEKRKDLEGEIRQQLNDYYETAEFRSKSKFYHKVLKAKVYKLKGIGSDEVNNMFKVPVTVNLNTIEGKYDSVIFRF